MDALDDFRARWRDRIRQRISEQVAAGPGHQAEVERRLEAVLGLEVSADADLMAAH